LAEFLVSSAHVDGDMLIIWLIKGFRSIVTPPVFVIRAEKPVYGDETLAYLPQRIAVYEAVYLSWQTEYLCWETDGDAELNLSASGMTGAVDNFNEAELRQVVDNIYSSYQSSYAASNVDLRWWRGLVQAHRFAAGSRRTKKRNPYDSEAPTFATR
jgi:hypothetical protein